MTLTDPEYARLCREVARLSALVDRQASFSGQMACVVRVERTRAKANECKFLLTH